MNKRTLFIVGGITAALLLCVCVAVAGFVVYNSMKTAEAVKTELDKIELATPEAVLSTVVAPAAGPDVPAEEAANLFLRYLGNNQYDDAVAATSSDLRGDATMAEQLRDIVEGKGLQPQSWEWQQTEVNGEKQHTYFDGAVTYADGRAGTVSVQLVFEENRWAVFYLDLKADGLSEEPALGAEDLAQVSADVFVEFWQAGDYGSAFAMGSSAFHEQVGSPDRLAEILGGTGLQIQSWSWETWETFEMADTGVQVIQWEGTAQFQDSLSGPLLVQLVEEEDGWLVLFFDVKTE